MRDSAGESQSAVTNDDVSARWSRSALEVLHLALVLLGGIASNHGLLRFTYT
jgi:hypothetical protein